MEQQFIIAIRVANKFGVLTRVSSMFSRRAFNIDSLTVGETETPGISRITVSMKGTQAAKNQLMKQLYKLQEVREISEMEDASVVRELMLIKVKVTQQTRQEIFDAVNVFRANILDYASTSFGIVITGESSKINAFIDILKPYGIIEMCRTGVVALERGEHSLRSKDMNYINNLEQ